MCGLSIESSGRGLLGCHAASADVADGASDPNFPDCGVTPKARTVHAARAFLHFPVSMHCRSAYSSPRGVEQLAARRAHNPKVAGSSPAPATKFESPLGSCRAGFLFLCLWRDCQKSRIIPAQRASIGVSVHTNDNWCMAWLSFVWFARVGAATKKCPYDMHKFVDSIRHDPLGEGMLVCRRKLSDVANVVRRHRGDASDVDLSVAYGVGAEGTPGRPAEGFDALNLQTVAT